MMRMFVIVLMVLAFLIPVAEIFAELPTVNERIDAYGNVEWVIDLGLWQVAVLDPARIALPDRFGSRFCRGGWLQRVTRISDGLELIRRDSLFSWHPSWGMTHDLNLVKSSSSRNKSTVMVKPGVGVVERVAADHFHDRIVRLFPWQTSCKRMQDEVRLLFIQTSPAGFPDPYRLTITTIFRPGPELIYEGELENIGLTDLEFSVCLHPFFEAAADRIGSRINFRGAIGPNAGINLTQMPFLYEAAVPPGVIAQVEITRIASSAVRLVIESAPVPDKMILWKNQSGECFAVEPWFRCVLPSGGRWRWSHRIVVAPL